MKLKHRPSDFRVDELLADGYLRSSGVYSVFHVTKSKLTSLEAAELLAHAAGCKPGDVAMAGLKDRQGVTSQYMSLRCKRNVRLDDGTLHIRRVGFADEPIRSAHSEGNRFRIRLRELDRRELGMIEASLEIVRVNGLPNYFDEQRFGNLRHDQGWIAKQLMFKRYEEALRTLLTGSSPWDDQREGGYKYSLRRAWGDWGACREIARRFRKHQSIFGHLKRSPQDFAGAFYRVASRIRLIHLYAFQSHLWNRAVAAWIGDVVGLEGACSSQSIEGALIFPRGAMPVADGIKDNFRLPGERFADVENPVQRMWLERALERHRLSPEQFIIEGVPGFQLKGTDRPLVVHPQKLDWQAPDRVPKDGRSASAVVSFDLPRGAYATLVSRRLVARLVYGRADPWYRPAPTPMGNRRPDGPPGDRERRHRSSGDDRGRGRGHRTSGGDRGRGGAARPEGDRGHGRKPDDRGRGRGPGGPGGPQRGQQGRGRRRD